MLRRGERFTLGGTKWRVVHVNASRAHCVSTAKHQVTISGRTFTATSSRTMDISPNSEPALYEALLKEIEHGH